MNPDKCLAWYRYPEPTGTEYHESDLKNEAIVETLFDYCQLWLGIIYPSGWKYLFEKHGSDKLLRIDERSDWFGEDDREYWMMYYARISGYDPVTDCFGTYNEDSGEFAPKNE